jgi:hypothetical protein
VRLLDAALFTRRDTEPALDDRKRQQVDLDAWNAVCEMVRCCFVLASDMTESDKLRHGFAMFDELIAKHSGAGARALFVNLIDFGGCLLLLAAEATKKSPEAVLDLMHLLSYEEDDSEH